MQSDQIKMTVLMPAYNAGGYIAEAIQSVLEQSFPDFELVIVDDGSTDETAEIIRSFNDSRIVLVSQKNTGIGGALNHGLKLARAPLIARFDADDICYPDRLKTQYQFMGDNPRCIVVGSAVDYVDESNRFIYSHLPPACTDKQIKALPYPVCPFIHSSVTYRKTAVLAVGGYNAHAHTFEDHLLWLQMAGAGAFFNISRRLIRVRLNPRSLTIDERWRSRSFLSMKSKALRDRKISRIEGEILLRMMKDQENEAIKDGAYHALLAKKFLFNNYQPALARVHIKKAIGSNQRQLDNYAIYLMSFLPRSVVSALYMTIKPAYGTTGVENLPSKSDLRYREAYNDEQFG